MNLQPNSFLQGDKYKIKRFISSGGFGCTYEAEHVMLQKRVAIKEFFVKDFCNRDEHTAHVTVGTQSKVGLVKKLRSKFIDEARALCTLEHKGIVHVTDVFEENGTAYFVMDYVDGLSLNDMVKRDGPMSEDRALFYIRQVCDALEYVHNHNRLHLDIKPANIMIGKDNRAVLIDFGASKQYDEVDGENTSTLTGKTPGYAPGEQMGNDVKKFLPATDIYALGATLYKLLTGITPLSSTDRSCGEELAPLPANVSQPTRKAVEAAMQMAKKNRPQSVEEFRKMLESNDSDDDATVVDVKPVEKKKPDEEKKPEKSNKRRNIVIAVCLVVTVIGLGIFFMKGGSTTETAETKDIMDITGTISGHDYVDLGLSVKWATCNVGASSPEGYGDYFAWGETSPKSSYTDDNSKTYNKQMGSICGDPNYDAATANWGSPWRLPTKAEIEELLNGCTYTWTTRNGVKGGVFKSKKNGNAIFVPAAGYRYGSSLYNAGSNGDIWGGSPYESNANFSYNLLFNSSSAVWDWNFRGSGRSVRPVSE